MEPRTADMRTQVLRDNNDNNESFIASSRLKEAADALLREEVVAFPTETVYGLGALWRSPKALREIFRIKGRPQDNPLILHVCDAEMAWSLASDVPEAAVILAKAFWPGPLTIILPADRRVPQEVTAGLTTVGLRCPAHPIAKRLIELTGEPLAAPSANISGRPSPTTLEDALEDLDGKVPFIIEGGASTVGLESTIVDLSRSGEAHLLRPGGITVQALDQAFELAGLKLRVQEPVLRYGMFSLSDGEVPRAPGMKYRHYAPRALVHLFSELDVEEAAHEVREWLNARACSQPEDDSPVGLFIRDDVWGCLLNQYGESIHTGHLQVVLFSADDQGRSAAHGLFAAFRQFDREGCAMIGVSSLCEKGYGGAFMNRVIRAADNSSQIQANE